MNFISQNINIAILVISGLAIVLLAWNIILQIGLSGIKKRQKVMLQGSKGKDLEQIILGNKKNISHLENDVKDLYEITSKIHSLASKGLFKVGMVRFNPFRDFGGDQSFSLALLDGSDNGIIISSLYSREGVRVYCKSILNKTSIKYPLTEEEKKAIDIASPLKNNQQVKKNIQ